MSSSSLARFNSKVWFLAAYLPLFVSVAPAFAEDSWVGQTVILKSSKAKIEQTEKKDEEKAVATLTHLSYQVITETDKRIKVRQEEVEGWLDKKEAVLASEAVDFFTARIGDAPTDADAFLRRAEAWKWKRDVQRALKDLNESIRLDPKEAYAFYHRGIVWKAQKEYDKAHGDFNEAIRLDAKQIGAFVSRGTVWMAKKKYVQAVGDYNEALSLDPKCVSAFNNRGNAWKALGEYDKAMQDYDEAIRLDPKHVAAFNNRGNLWRARREYDKAMQDYDEAIRLDPKHVLAFYNRGTAWKAQKEYNKALHDYDEALRLDPSHVLTLNIKAGLLATCQDEKIRDGKKAVELATRACELTKWKNPAYLSTLAACCAETGDFANAVKWQEKALEDAEYAKAFGPVLLPRLQLYKDNKPFREE